MPGSTLGRWRVRSRLGIRARCLILRLFGGFLNNITVIWFIWLVIFRCCFSSTNRINGRIHRGSGTLESIRPPERKDRSRDRLRGWHLVSCGLGSSKPVTKVVKTTSPPGEGERGVDGLLVGEKAPR
jgi:hypothetical protein